MLVSRVQTSIQYPRPTHPRSPGVHLSGIIRDLAIREGHLKADVARLEELGLSDVSDNQWWAGLDEPSRLRICMGLAWEQWYLPHIEVALHPGEMHLDGIYMTHDGESLDAVYHTDDGQPTFPGMLPDDYELAVHEVKLTYKSTNTVRDLQYQAMWLWQTMGYAKALNTRVAYVHVLFVCGDYARPIQPCLKLWRLDFEQWEIDQHWDRMVTHMHWKLAQEREEQMRDIL